MTHRRFLILKARGTLAPHHPSAFQDANKMCSISLSAEANRPQLFRKEMLDILLVSSNVKPLTWNDSNLEMASDMKRINSEAEDIEELPVIRKGGKLRIASLPILERTRSLVYNKLSASAPSSLIWKGKSKVNQLTSSKLHCQCLISSVYALIMHS